MLAIRSLARSSSRAVNQLTLRATPRQPSLFSRTAWTTSAFRASPIVAAAPRILTASFSSTSRSFSDYEDLLLKLDQEIKLESDLDSGNQPSAADSGIQELVKSIESKGWELQETPGEQEIALVKKRDNETLRVTFSTADVNNADEYPEPFPEEEEEGLDNAENPDGQPAESAYPSESIPVGITLQITKEGKQGALLVEASAANGSIIVDEFYYLKDAELAQPKTFEAEKTRAELYPGPSFNNLDEELQDLLYSYVQEWGVNEELAMFVVDYIELKEQKDYMKWLGDVREFLA